MLERKNVQDLELDEGGILQVDGKTKGVYRDLDNQCHVDAMSSTWAVRTSVVQWNGIVPSDPWHGSRFDAKGNVLEAPATKSLSYSKREDL